MYGRYDRNLDDKKRIVIPSKFKTELGETFFLTLSFDKCIELRNEKEFKIFTEKLNSKNSLNPQLRKLVRFLLSNTFEVTLDKSSRVVIPESLLQKTAIEKEIVFIGNGNKAEIWAKDKYDILDEEFSDEENVDQIIEDLNKSGIDI